MAMQLRQPDEVVAAIIALYGPGDPSFKATVNDLLMRFAKTPEAWQIGASLLSHASEEVRYFCANMLLVKVRTERQSLAPNVQGALCQEVGRCLFTLSSQPGSTPVVISRLCLLMVALACRSPEPPQDPSILTTRSLSETALQLAASAMGSNQNATAQIFVVLQLLLALTEEVEQLDRTRQLAAQESMAQRTADVLRLVQAVLLGHLGGGASEGAALNLLRGWLKDEKGITSGVLVRSYSDLYQQVLARLASPDDAIAEAASEVIVDLVSQDSGAAQDLEWEEKAVRMVLEVVAGQREQLRQALQDAQDCQLARGLAEVARALAEHWWELVAQAAKGSSEAVPVAEAMLLCVNFGSRNEAETALDFFSMLSMVPLAERWPALQAPLYEQLLQALLKQSAYPSNFTTWQESSDDSDAFFRFRELSAAETLETCYAVLGPQYLQSLGEHLKSARSWQAIEVCLFALRCTAATVKKRYQPPNGTHHLPSAVVDAFFVPFFAQLSGDDFFSHPLVGSAAASLIGSFGAWVNQNLQILNAAVGFLLRGLQTSLQGTMPTVWKASARAFQSLCIQCTAHMSQPAAVEQLIQAVETSLPPLSNGSSSATVDVEDRTAVNDGLATLIAALPFDEASRLGARLMTPCVTSLGKLASGDSSTSACVGCLHLLASSIRHLEFGTSDSTAPQTEPCAALVQLAWPTLDALLKLPWVQESSEVLGALSEVYTRTFQSLGTENLPTADVILQLVGVFERTQHPECVSPIVTAVQCTSKGQLATQATFYRGLFEAVSRAAFATWQAGQLEKTPEVLGALFALAAAYASHCPSVLMSTGLLASLLQAATAVIRVQGKDSVKSTLTFLGALLELPSKDPSQRTVIEEALQQAGQGLTAALLFAVADKLPRELIRSIGGVLYLLIQYSPATVGAWAASTVGSTEFAGVVDGALTEEDKQLVCSLFQRQPPLPRRRFEAMIADLASVSRREGTSDALLAYQI